MAQDAKHVKVKFLRNVSYEGKEYGPDYKEDTVTVPAHWAQRFIAQGRATEVAEKEKK